MVAGESQDPSVPAPGVERARTGDRAVDEVLGQLDQLTDEPLDVQIEGGEQAHRVLQGRLADLGPEPGPDLGPDLAQE